MVGNNEGYTLEKGKNGKYMCARCLQYTLDVIGEHDYCPVCGWEDDCLQNKDIRFAGGANHMSIIEARKACSEGRGIE